VPHFLLQPLVENAVLHGIAPKARPGRIEIRAFRNGRHLTLEVCDSGDGLPPDQLAAINDGVGLGNTRARLQHLYGTDHAFVFSNVAGGFKVTVTIPFRAATTPPLDAVSAEVA
jgi:sensor histidine kinase YesM